MKIVIEARSKEIAALVVALQVRRKRGLHLNFDSKSIAQTAIDDMRKAISENT